MDHPPDEWECFDHVLNIFSHQNDEKWWQNDAKSVGLIVESWWTWWIMWQHLYSRRQWCSGRLPAQPSGVTRPGDESWIWSLVIMVCSKIPQEMILPLKPSSSFVDFPPWLHESSIGILKKPWLRGRGQTGDPKYHIFKYVPNIPTSSDFAVPIIHTQNPGHTDPSCLRADICAAICQAFRWISHHCENHQAGSISMCLQMEDYILRIWPFFNGKMIMKPVWWRIVCFISTGNSLSSVQNPKCHSMKY